MKKIYGAIKGISRTTDELKYGSYIFTTKESENRFRFFEMLSTTSPHVFIPLLKLSHSIVKGIRFEGDKRTLVRNFENWAEKINFKQIVQNLARLLVRNGIYVARFININNVDKLNIQPFLMSRTTIVTADVKKPGEFPDTIMQPPCTKVYINELDEQNRKVFDFNKVVYGAFCQYDYVITDILGRETYGIYGISILEPLADLIKKYLDLLESYTKYVKRYGFGRYFIKYRLLEELMKDGMVDAETARNMIEELTKEHEKILENEDIIGAGFDIQELDTKQNIDIVKFKESLETDIQVGLLQHPLTMGRAKGTTYAAGYVSESDRMVVLESLQKVIKDIVNGQIINKRLELMGRQAGSVWVVFDELSKPERDARDLLDMFVNGVITQEEARRELGFSNVIE